MTTSLPHACRLGAMAACLLFATQARAQEEDDRYVKALEGKTLDTAGDFRASWP